MGRYQIDLEGDLKEKAVTEMSAAGLKSIASYIRNLIANSGQRRWTDEDMKEFARKYSHRTPNPPGLLELEDHQLEREFNRFKINR